MFILMIRETQISATISSYSLLKPSQLNQSSAHECTAPHSDNARPKGYEAELHIYVHQNSLCNVDGNWLSLMRWTAGTTDFNFR